MKSDPICIMTTSLILRCGQKAEVLAWGIAFLFQPISAVITLVLAVAMLTAGQFLL